MWVVVCRCSCCEQNVVLRPIDVQTVNGASRCNCLMVVMAVGIINGRRGGVRDTVRSEYQRLRVGDASQRHIQVQLCGVILRHDQAVLTAAGSIGSMDGLGGCGNADSRAVTARGRWRWWERKELWQGRSRFARGERVVDDDDNRRRQQTATATAATGPAGVATGYCASAAAHGTDTDMCCG